MALGVSVPVMTERSSVAARSRRWARSVRGCHGSARLDRCLAASPSLRSSCSRGDVGMHRARRRSPAPGRACLPDDAIPYPPTCSSPRSPSTRVPARVERRTQAGSSSRRSQSRASGMGDRERRRRDWVVDRDQPLLVRISTRTNKLTKRFHLPEARSTSEADATSRGSRSTTAARGARHDVDQSCRRAHLRRRRAVGFATGASTWVLSHRDGALVRFDGRDRRPCTASRLTTSHARADDARRRLALDHGSRPRPRTGRSGTRRAWHDRDRRGGHRRRRSRQAGRSIPRATGAAVGSVQRRMDRPGRRAWFFARARRRQRRR